MRDVRRFVGRVVGLAFPFPLAFATAVAGDSTLRVECTVDASSAAVWQALTTTDGLRRWRSPDASVDLRVGGLVLVDDARLDGATTPIPATLEILAFEPEHVLVSKFHAVAEPVSLQFGDHPRQIWRFVPREIGTTRVSMTWSGVDTLAAADRDELEDRSWAELELLRKSFQEPERRAESDVVLERFAGLVGSFWTSEIPSGASSMPFLLYVRRIPGPRTFHVVEFVPGKRSARAAIAHSMVWSEPTSGRCRLLRIAYDGATISGLVRPHGEADVAIECDAADADGTSRRILLRTSTGADRSITITGFVRDALGAWTPYLERRLEHASEMPAWAVDPPPEPVVPPTSEK